MPKHLFICLPILLLALPLWAGEADDYYQAGLNYYKARPLDAVGAASAFGRAAELGHAGAQTYLGLMYLSGQGLPQNYAMAIRFFEQAAKAGDPQAQLMLGQLYRNGRGLRMNKRQALIWFQRSAARGNSEAQATLAEMYATGQEVPLDYVGAHMWWNVLAAQGNKPAAQKRAAIEAYLTPAQLARAQRLAADFKPVARP